MFRSFRLGTLLGFPIEINVSFLLLLGVVLVLTGGVAGVLFVLLAFASVLLHELGHALVARRLRVPIAGIELHFFGGMAKMTGMPRTANDEVAIAAAGPLVSFALGGLGLLAGAVTGSWFFQLAGWINVVIGAFNLVPALPMDGGRILRALLTRKMAFSRATEVSIHVARAFAVLLAAWGVVAMQIYPLLLAVVLWAMGSNERSVARQLDPYMSYDGSGYRRRDVAVEPEVLTLGFGLGGLDDPYGRGGPGAPGEPGWRRHPRGTFREVPAPRWHGLPLSWLFIRRR